MYMEDFKLISKQNLKVILLAEDDEEDIFLFTDVLDTLYKDIDVKVVNDGFQAISSLQELSLPDIIFVDIKMPLMNGIACLTSIKDANSTIPVIILTTSKDNDLIEQAKSLGASGFISKPTSFMSYRKVMNQVLSIDWEANEGAFFLSI